MEDNKMERKYRHDTNLYERCCKGKSRQLFSLFATPFGIFCIINGLIELKALDDDFLFDGLNFGTLLIILCLIVMITAVINYRKLFIICNNMPKCFLEIKETYISGYAFDRIHENDNGSYFEVNYDEIRSVNTNYTCFDSFLDLYNSNNFYNLIIHTSKGTYKLCLEKVKDAKNQIESIMQGKIETEEKDCNNTIITRKPDLNKDYILPVKILKNGTGTTSCPVCSTEQPDDRYSCLKCGVPFINNIKDIPYWCLNCGLPGPFDGKCPKCNSDIKRMNN